MCQQKFVEFLLKHCSLQLDIRFVHLVLVVEDACVTGDHQSRFLYVEVTGVELTASTTSPGTARKKTQISMVSTAFRSVPYFAVCLWDSFGLLNGWVPGQDECRHWTRVLFFFFLVMAMIVS